MGDKNPLLSPIAPGLFPPIGETTTAPNALLRKPAPTPFKFSMTNNKTGEKYTSYIADDAAERMVHLLNGLPDKDRMAALNDIRRQLDDQKRNPTKDGLFALEGNVTKVERMLAADDAMNILADLKDWRAPKVISLERASRSRAHVLRAALDEGRWYDWKVVDGHAEADHGGRQDDLAIGQVFVVEHDWASVFAGASVSGQVNLDLWSAPYERSCFEFQYSGRHVCALVHQPEGGAAEMAVLVECKDFGGGAWVSLANEDPWRPLVAAVKTQVRAICISLEAEAAITEVVRVPHKLNAARERRGKPPIFEHRVVKLARRSRPATLPDADAIKEPGARKRLHFRRGHDRHYRTYKVRIKWQLVGDPDLGFVDKEYRL